MGRGWDIVLAARAGNWRQSDVAIISLDRRTTGAGGKDVKFELAMRPLDHTHTHGEMERCDREAVMKALAKAADEIVAILRRVPPKPS